MKARSRDGRRVLPSWFSAAIRVQNGTANPLERFLYSNEPAGKPAERQFREELTAALEWYAQNDRAHRPASGTVMPVGI